MRVLFSAAFQSINQFTKPVRDSLVHDFVVHGPKLLAETSLHVSAQFGRFRAGLLAPGGGGFHLILLSHGLSFVHCSTPTSRGLGQGPVAPLFCAKHVTWQMVPVERNFFAALAFARYRLIGLWGATPVRI